MFGGYFMHRSTNNMAKTEHETEHLMIRFMSWLKYLFAAEKRDHDHDAV